jgi:hypothetical protein
MHCNQGDTPGSLRRRCTPRGGSVARA